MDSSLYYPMCYALLSGGKDSLTTVEVLARAGRLIACVSFETGIPTPDWKPFVIKTCQERGWPVEFYKTDESYADLVLQYGFPGPGKHGLFMNYLKGRCVRKFKKAHPDGILASGTRVGESDRRFINTKPISFWEGVPILTPIYDKSTDEVWRFFHENGFTRAPAYSTLQISGDCLCGGFCRGPEERQAIDVHYPKFGEFLTDLGHERRAVCEKTCPRALAAAQIRTTRHEWGWGWKQPRKKTVKESAICVECGDADPIELP